MNSGSANHFLNFQFDELQGPFKIGKFSRSMLAVGAWRKVDSS